MYADFFGLTQEPFRLTPDPRFLHLAEPHRNTLGNMLEGITGHKGLQVAMGPVGTGKTTLLYCLQHILMHQNSPENPIRTAFIVNPVLAPDELYETLLDELEVTCASNSKPGRLRALCELLFDAYRRNGRLVIIIDEAHLLSQGLLEEVRLLLNLDNYRGNVLQVILCGQPELAQILRRPQFAALRGRIAVISKLRPLTLFEVQAYITERLQIAGLRGQVPFTTTAIEEIHRQSNGTPRVINLLCDNAMTLAFRKLVTKIGPELVVGAVDALTLDDNGPEAFDAVESDLVPSSADTSMEALKEIFRGLK